MLTDVPRTPRTLSRPPGHPLAVLVGLVVITLIIPTAVAQLKSDGVTCSADNECVSSDCRNNCCRVGADPDCRVCSSSGGCSSCYEGYVLYQSVCRRAGGSSCLGSKQCHRDCKNNYCCLNNDANCVKCDSTGECSECEPGYAKSSGGYCKKPNGATCASDSECSSQVCKTNRCCAAADKNCNTCASGTGVCTACSAAFQLTNGYCKLGPGSACNSGTQCVSDSCIGFKCCIANVESRCNACDGTTGLCKSCDSGFEVKAGTCKVSPSGSCGSDADCARGTCSEGKCINNPGDSCQTYRECPGLCRSVCCAANVTRCSLCDNSEGTCDSCSNGYELSEGDCKGQTGQGCYKDSECVSGVCKGGICKIRTGQQCYGTSSDCEHSLCRGSFCCKEGNDGICTACQSGSGDCTFCISGYTPANGVCKKATGESCNQGLDCATGLCSSGKKCVSNFGASCSVSDDCFTKNCQSSVCCSNAAGAQCTRCAIYSGRCTQCSGDYEVFDGGCKKPYNRACAKDWECASMRCDANSLCTKVIADVCTESSECGTENCRGGVCCWASPALSTGCLSCDGANDGRCKICDSKYYLATDSTCSRKSDAGSGCSAAETCLSGICLGSRCCAANVSERCTMCNDASGACTACNRNYEVSDGVCKKILGSTCSTDSECSGVCIGNTCKRRAGETCSNGNIDCAVGVCSSGVCCRSNCKSCTSTGACDSCASSIFYLDEGDCNLKRVDGAVCGTGPSCKSGSCVGGVCCAGNVTSKCTACHSATELVPNGTCSTCEEAYDVVDGVCKKSLGQVCSDSSECATGRCSGRNVCAKPTGKACLESTECDSSQCGGGICCNSSAGAGCSRCKVGNGKCLECQPGYSITVDESCVLTTTAVSTEAPIELTTAVPSTVDSTPSEPPLPTTATVDLTPSVLPLPTTVTTETPAANSTANVSSAPTPTAVGLEVTLTGNYSADMLNTTAKALEVELAVAAGLAAILGVAATDVVVESVQIVDGSLAVQFTVNASSLEQRNASTTTSGVAAASLSSDLQAAAQNSTLVASAFSELETSTGVAAKIGNVQAAATPPPQNGESRGANRDGGNDDATECGDGCLAGVFVAAVVLPILLIVIIVVLARRKLTAVAEPAEKEASPNEPIGEDGLKGSHSQA